MGGHRGVVKLLLTPGCPAEANKGGQAELLGVIANGNSDAVSILLEEGARPKTLKTPGSPEALKSPKALKKGPKP
eukprot:1310469-Pyramimonas_sp.AAC.1